MREEQRWSEAMRAHERIPCPGAAWLCFGLLLKMGVGAKREHEVGARLLRCWLLARCRCRRRRSRLLLDASRAHSFALLLELRVRVEVHDLPLVARRALLGGLAGRLGLRGDGAQGIGDARFVEAG